MTAEHLLDEAKERLRQLREQAPRLHAEEYEVSTLSSKATVCGRRVMKAHIAEHVEFVTCPLCQAELARRETLDV